MHSCWFLSLTLPKTKLHISSFNATAWCYDIYCLVVSLCTSLAGRERLQNVTQEGLVPFVVDAVYALAHALERLHALKCPGGHEVCGDMLPLAGPDLLEQIRQVNFVG